jgi:hypothetical protein
MVLMGTRPSGAISLEDPGGSSERIALLRSWGSFDRQTGEPLPKDRNLLTPQIDVGTDFRQFVRGRPRIGLEGCEELFGLPQQPLGEGGDLMEGRDQLCAFH